MAAVDGRGGPVEDEADRTWKDEDANVWEWWTDEDGHLCQRIIHEAGPA